MRLLDSRTLLLYEFFGHDIPPYAILSHTWGQDEVSFQDLRTGNAERKLGCWKIKKFCELAAMHGFEYAWVDTCCIDKTSSAELQEAICSMYQWYKNAQVCYVYLEDYSKLHGKVNFWACRWFRRGWTLQELIAPAFVEFYDAEWDEIGTKSSLCWYISAVTFIDELVLRGADPTKRTVAERMSWAASRSTTRVEDSAYCLMGLFNVFMPMLYGEGSRAFIRLQEEILRQEEDYTIFVWKSKGSSDRGLFAHSPVEFLGSEVAVGVPSRLHQPAHQPATTLMTPRGLLIDLPLLLLSAEHNTYLAWVCCLKPEDPNKIEQAKTILCVTLRQLQSKPQIFVRSSPRELVFLLEKDALLFVRRQVYVLPSGTMTTYNRKRGQMGNRRCGAPQLVRAHLPAGIEGAVLWTSGSMVFEGTTGTHPPLNEELSDPCTYSAESYYVEEPVALAALQFQGLQKFVILIGFHDDFPWCAIVPYDEEKAEDISMRKWQHADFSRFTDRASESLSSNSTVTAAIRVAPPSTLSHDWWSDPITRFARECGPACTVFNLYVRHIQRPISQGDQDIRNEMSWKPRDILRETT